MPRDVSGNYTLPTGNPVVDNTTITSTWGNDTLNDIAAQLNNVLTRDGLLGATGVQKFASGSAAAPGIAWTSESSSGFFRVTANVMGASIAGTEVSRWSASGFNVTGTFVASGAATVNSLAVTAGATVGAALGVTGALTVNSTGAFTGAVTGPTAAVDTNTTQLATTAYVINQLYIKAATAAATYAPLGGAGASGTWGINITGNSGTVGGLALQAGGGTAPGANVVLRTEANGYAFFNYINTNVGNSENPAIGQFLVTNGGDGFLRKASLAHVNNSISPAWTNVTGRPTDLGSFSNGPGYITASSPALSGNPTAPTPSTGDNDTSIATTAFVRNNAPGWSYSANLFSGSRVVDTTYTNNTGRPIFVSVSGVGGPNAELHGLIDGTVRATSSSPTSSGGRIAVSWFIPPGSTYMALQVTSTTSLSFWYEF